VRPAREAAQRYYGAFGGKVEGAGGVVEDEHPGIDQEGAGEDHQLALVG
jgi:hypothetical protein